MDLKGKVALITGAAAGIGRAYCEELLRHGAKVSICDLNAEVGEKLADQLCTKYGHGKALFCQCDVTDYPQFEESFQKTISAFGGLDIVINNAGIFNDRFWELEVDVNLNGVIRGTLLALRFLGKDRGGRGGTVITTASTLGLQPCACVPIYTATKHAIIGFTRSLGDPFHMSLSGVRMMALCPGATRTESNADEIKKGLLFPDYEAAYHRDYDNRVHQPVEAVAKALIHILQKGTSGSVWVVENQQTPREVKLPASI
ncbi:15-hydroxyprostaglandin dehydrogenase [NAD(+)]-like [Macrosteles quadrilineatus]|uniref:15-hydroxyprostaglandin dehydrogenase [NAD(+)]-like n=1 Tax=Macrosteles quadrilineatus TaxID=74068 RepID=UPI0023E30A35|nr:15-hydroxyprostaglandin dehydrogenase [NAD(+)]-like [Macrosteles quadrilineatus]